MIRECSPLASTKDINDAIELEMKFKNKKEKRKKERNANDQQIDKGKRRFVINASVLEEWKQRGQMKHERKSGIKRERERKEKMT